MQGEMFELHERIELTHWWFVARRRILLSLADALLGEPLASGRRPVVVDVGCGTGANIAALAERGYESLGLDTEPAAIASAARRFGDRVRWVEGTGEALDVVPDLVLLMDVLEHVEDAPGLLRPWVDRLHVGGRVLITVPADPSLWTRHDEVFGHYRRYTIQTLPPVWADMPVRVRLLSYYNARLYPFVKAIRAWRARTGGTDRGDDFSIPAWPLNHVLNALMAGERHALLRALGRGDGKPTYRRGVSLIAVLEKTEASC